MQQTRLHETASIVLSNNFCELPSSGLNKKGGTFAIMVSPTAQHINHEDHPGENNQQINIFLIFYVYRFFCHFVHTNWYWVSTQMLLRHD
jgi:hypothetical protein